MTEPTPTWNPGQPKRHADFGTIAQALDYAAEGATGFNFYSGKGELSEVLPYAVLREQAMGLARRMLGAGLRPGDRVGLIADNNGDFARAFFACQYAGLVPAPLPLPTAFGGRQGYVDHLRRMLQSASATAAFAADELASWLDEACEGLHLKASGTLAALDPVVPVLTLPAQDPDALGYLQFSSGSTRFPIGVAVTQRAFMANARGIGRDGLAVRDGDRGLSWLPFYHDMGLVGFFLMPMCCQTSVDILSARDFARRPLLWLQLLSRNRATISFSPSFGYELCARRAETASLEGLDLSCWRSAGIGGDMIRPHVLTRFTERFAGCGFNPAAFVPSYGMAEATLALSFTPSGRGAQADTVDATVLESLGQAAPAQETSIRSRSFMLCGEVLPGHDIEVRDDSGNVLPDRAVGRIFARGPSLMTGYFGEVEETRRVMADGWLDTGDLGYFLNKQIVITGRAKDLIIVNGRNLWPQDLEWAAEHDVAALRTGDVAVFSVDSASQEDVVVLVQCRLTDEAARETLTAELFNIFRARHGVEARVVLVPPRSLPQTSSGKLSRSRARALYQEGAFAEPSMLAAAD